jgi:hypothetical protein
MGPALCLVVCESKDRIVIGVPAIARGSGGGVGFWRRSSGRVRLTPEHAQLSTMRRHASAVLDALDGHGSAVGLKPRAIHAR